MSSLTIYKFLPMSMLHWATVVLFGLIITTIVGLFAINASTSVGRGVGGDNDRGDKNVMLNVTLLNEVLQHYNK